MSEEERPPEEPEQPTGPWESVTERLARERREGIASAEKSSAGLFTEEDLEVLRAASTLSVTGTLGEAVTIRHPDGSEGYGYVDKNGVVRPFPAPQTRAPQALVSPDPFAGRRLAPFASGAPAAGAAAALVRARSWPVDDSGRPVFVHKVEGRHLTAVFHYQVVVPGDPSGEVVDLAHADLARSILRDMGRDTAWLHMLMLAYAAQGRPGERVVVPRAAVYRALGLDKRSDLPRREKDRRCFEEIGRLRSLGVAIMRLWLGNQDLTRDGKRGQTVDWHRRTGALWFLTLDEFGQARFEADGDGRLVKRWDDFQVLVRAGEWAQLFLYRHPLRQLGYLAREMFTNLDRRRSPWGLDFAVYLAFEGRLAGGGRLAVRNRDLVEFAGGPLDPPTREARREAFARFLAGIEDQRAWGARPEYTEWPEAIRPDLDAARADGLAAEGSDGSEATPRRMPQGYWKDFINARTGFVLPDDLAQWNAQAARPPRRLPAPAKPPDSQAPDPVTAAEVRELRRRRGLTLAQLAGHLGVSKTLASYLESGRRKISPDAAERIRALRVSPEPELGL